MTTDKLAGVAGTTVSMEARRAAVGMCHCGQELDICTRTHCPRCGSTVTGTVTSTVTSTVSGAVERRLVLR